MFNEYIRFYKQYSEKYGVKTAIFLMVGSFYELYDLQNNETGETECNILEIVDYLGIQLSSKKGGDIGENQTGLFAGFPDYVLHKWAGRLTSAGWTVVIVDQIKDSRGKVSERKVSRILSPSTHIENATSCETPYITTLYFYQQNNETPLFGASVLDLTTGTTITYSGITQGRSDVWTTDDLTQMLNIYTPKELLIYWNSPYNIPDDVFFRRMFNLSFRVPIHRRNVETIGSFSSELVRSEYLQKIYSIQSLLSPKIYLGLRSNEEELALLYLLQFIEEHFPSVLTERSSASPSGKSFNRNESWNPQTRLICGNHALTQLQMTGNQSHETVVYLFNRCITPMGKRAIRERLLSPCSDASQIQNRLDQVQDYLNWKEEKSRLLERQLRFMFDLPRLHRKILCGMIQSSEIVGLFQTYSAIQVVFKDITQDTNLRHPFSDENWMQYQKVFQSHFSEDKSRRCSEDISIFNSTTYSDIGKVEQEIETVLNGFADLRKEITDKAECVLDAVRIEKREKEPFGFKASVSTIQQLKKKLPEGFKFSELKSGGWIDCSRLQQLNISLQRLRERLVYLVREHLIEACLEVSNVGQQLWEILETWIAHVDCTQCIGRVSKERGFSCPDIKPVNESGSWVKIKQMRHPLVEASASKVEYVKHDVSLGNQDSTGWLIYGMNASGKSTLMKAVGICVLLAQAGCFVPAKTMEISPFRAIYTRILNQDNLFAGLSSFAVEMSELRDILRNVDQYSLVLGDELCSGTESVSAQALVSSGIQWLSSKQSKFIFATHLHGLTEWLDLNHLHVKVWHLHVEYEPTTGKLIYDRSLRSGNGSTLYGLEVARAMDLPFDFIEQALQNRNQIMGSKRLNDTTHSSWSKEVYKKECEICKSAICSELEVHHIVPREEAIQNRLSDGSHMNDKRNLIVVCQKCHDDVHRGQIQIGSVKMTSNGPERKIEKKQILTKKTKWSEDELQTIHQILKIYTNLSLKSIRAHLNSKYSIDISESNLGKIRKSLG
jgi:DNA mismatch repair protein MutS